MKRNFALSLGLGLLVLGGTITQSRTAYAQTPMTVGTPERDFMSEVSQANLGEIQAAELALTRSNNVNVQRLARMIIEHHKMAQDELMGQAASRSVVLPTSPDTMSSEKYDKLDNLYGDAFDHAYIKSQIWAHKEAIWKFQRVLQETEDRQVKNYAWGTLPLLRRHLEEFKYLKSSGHTWSPFN